MALGQTRCDGHNPLEAHWSGSGRYDHWKYQWMIFDTTNIVDISLLVLIIMISLFILNCSTTIFIIVIIIIIVVVMFNRLSWLC